MEFLWNLFWASVELVGMLLGLLALYFVFYFLGIGLVYLCHLILA